MKPIIEVRGISKSYSITHSNERYVSLRDSIMNVVRAPFRFLKQKARVAIGRSSNDVFWALKNVNTSINAGEIVGVIGANGAGKSTFLKVLNRITEPTSGEVVVRGKISSLLEVGTGFHPELTGRENIFFNGAILGMTRKEIAQKFDAIVAFAEMQQFLDTPVKRYSSGMNVRLAFSVAVHMEPDILLIDEVLAVGDAAFQKKCLEKIHEVAKRDKRTILFVSHNLDAVQSLCERTLLFEKGEITTEGETQHVIKTYLNRQATAVQQATVVLPALPEKPFQITQVMIRNVQGAPETTIEAGQPFSVEVTYETRIERAGFLIILQCINEYGSTVFFVRDTDVNTELITHRTRGVHTSTFTFPAGSHISLNTGRYTITARIDSDPASEVVLPITISDTLKRFNHFPGSILVGDAWKNSENEHRREK